MKVKELIAALQLCDQELEVYGYCDHGQTPEKVQVPSEIFAGSLDHTLYDNHVNDLEEAEFMGYTHKAIML